jgi:flagella basal body P-ring formation protein FlgA
MRVTLSLAALALTAGLAAAADPVAVVLEDRPTARTAVVTVADVARVTGGDPAIRARVAALDLAELKARDPAVTVSRRAVEYRLRLAGIEPGQVVVVGPDAAVVTVARRPVTADEVVAAARAEVLRQLGAAPETVTVELAQPVAVKLPEVPAGEAVAVAAKPHGRVPATGRVQVDVAVSCAGEKLISFAVVLDVKPGGRPDAAAAPAGAKPGEVLVRPRSRVTMQVKSGVMTATAVGEALQEGRLGQTIQVQNVDSKKTLSVRVVGPGLVEIDLGGAP